MPETTVRHTRAARLARLVTAYLLHRRHLLLLARVLRWVEPAAEAVLYVLQALITQHSLVIDYRQDSEP